MRDNENTFIELPGLVSIIIPAYNSERYIKQMFESICLQTYQNIEVIVAYDVKSSDNTYSILKECVSSLPLDITINVQDDSSIGNARNRGLSFAKGEYVIFLDSDDIITPKYIENMVNVFNKESNLDLVCGSYISTTEEYVSEHYAQLIHDSLDICSYSLQRTDNVIQRWLDWDVPRYVWCWLIRRRYLFEHRILFPPCSHGEDQVFTLSIVLDTDVVGFLDDIGYIYIIHTDSQDHKYKSPIVRWENDKCMRVAFHGLLSSDYPHLEKEIINRLTMEFISKIRGVSYGEFKKILVNYKIDKVLPITWSSPIGFTMIQCCFNLSKSLYWFIFQIRRLFRIIQDKLWGNLVSNLN